jgi:hypothetical protein
MAKRRSRTTAMYSPTESRCYSSVKALSISVKAWLKRQRARREGSLRAALLFCFRVFALRSSLSWGDRCLFFTPRRCRKEIDETDFVSRLDRHRRLTDKRATQRWSMVLMKCDFCLFCIPSPRVSALACCAVQLVKVEVFHEA